MTQSKTVPKPRVGQQAGGRAVSGSDSTPPMIVRAEHSAFGDLDELTRKAGVPVRELAKIVAKELGDNALDKAEACTFGRLKRGGFYVRNEGDFPGTPREVAALFSTGRLQTSTKLYRRPMRGALGNGLRVVAGAVLASGGRLVVQTGGRCLQLKPRHDGTTAVRKLPNWRSLPRGVTRVCVWLGPSIPVGDDVLDSVILAAELTSPTKKKFRPSAHWHTPESFAGLMRDANGATVLQVVEQFNGLAGAKAAEVCGDLSGLASAVPRGDAIALYERMKDAAPAPGPDALGRVGTLDGWGRPRHEDTTFKRSGVEMPVRIEVWARPAQKFSVNVCVNRTLCPAKVSLRVGERSEKGKMKKCLYVTGGGLSDWVGGTGRKPVEVLVNVQCPAMPLTDDGKTPDLGVIDQAIVDKIGRAVKAATRAAVMAAVGFGLAKVSQKAVIRANLADAVASISLGGKVVYTLRNLFYALRPKLIKAIGREPNYGTFADIIGDYEDEFGELPRLCRDNRGLLHEPHTGKQMPLGTLTAKSYKRPPFLFNKVLYCEKEGFFPQLIDAGWPARHDCALLTSKGFATRAVGDLLAAMDESDEPLTIFCVHDADGPGTVIFEALRALVSKRRGRPVRVVNLGLDPDEALAMGLQVEPVTPRKGKTVPTGSYLEPRWKDWLQSHRVELNAIKPVNFLAWLDGKMAGHAGKVVPPDVVVADRIREAAEKEVREQVTERLLKAGGYEDLVAAEMARLTPALDDAATQFSDSLPETLANRRQEYWGDIADEVGAEVVAVEAGPESAGINAD